MPEGTIARLFIDKGSGSYAMKTTSSTSSTEVPYGAPSSRCCGPTPGIHARRHRERSARRERASVLVLMRNKESIDAVTGALNERQLIFPTLLRRRTP